MAVSHTRDRRQLTPVRPIRPMRPRRRRSRARYGVLALALVVAALAAVAVWVKTSHASLSSDSVALAKVELPAAGGQVERLSVVGGPHSQAVPASLRGGRVWPTAAIPAGEQVQVQVVVRRPAWLSWLTGHREHLTLNLRVPSSGLVAPYVTLKGSAPLVATFTTPVAYVAYGPNGRLQRRTLPVPLRQITLPHGGPAGSMWVTAAPRVWERARPVLISWFPAGARASAIASPLPGTPIAPGTPITLTFSKPVSDALGHSLPPVSPATQGGWRQLDAHTIVFRPAGYGYGLGARVTVALPAGVSLLGGAHTAAGTIGRWRVPPGSTLRLQQLLAELGYLPLGFTPQTPVALTAPAQEAAAVRPPAGAFSWRYPDVPAALRSFWAPGASGVMTQGAVMAFENDHGLATDGDPGPLVWRALMAAVLAGQRSSFGYTFVDVGISSQQLRLWHNGHTVLSTPVNTGIPQAPTQPGTYPVYEHLRVTTMSGTNPDGSHYHDPGIQFVSYFHGGDALHAFTRAQYGFPQSLGCVEMPLAPAGRVWPYTPIGTLVHVA